MKAELAPQSVSGGAVTGGAQEGLGKGGALNILCAGLEGEMPFF